MDQGHFYHPEVIILRVSHHRRTQCHQPGLMFGRRFCPRAGRFPQVLAHIAAPALSWGLCKLGPTAWLGSEHNNIIFFRKMDQSSSQTLQKPTAASTVPLSQSRASRFSPRAQCLWTGLQDAPARVWGWNRHRRTGNALTCALLAKAAQPGPGWSSGLGLQLRKVWKETKALSTQQLSTKTPWSHSRGRARGRGGAFKSACLSVMHNTATPQQKQQAEPLENSSIKLLPPVSAHRNLCRIQLRGFKEGAVLGDVSFPSLWVHTQAEQAAEKQSLPSLLRAAPHLLPEPSFAVSRAGSLDSPL